VHISLLLALGSATLTVQVFDPICGTPVVGVSVSVGFPTLLGTIECAAVTDRTGSARCTLRLGVLLRLIAGSHYTVLTKPTARYAGGSAFGQILA
jgi:hypothetical protein